MNIWILCCTMLFLNKSLIFFNWDMFNLNLVFCKQGKEIKWVKPFAMFTEQRSVCFDGSFNIYGIKKSYSQGGFCCCGSVVRDNYKELLAEQKYPLKYSYADFKLPASEKVNASSLPGHLRAFDICRTNSYDDQLFIFSSIWTSYPYL